MLTGLHFLLTYKCNSECDHCFIFSGPHSKGTFTLSQIRQLLNEAVKIGTIEMIYFEGGEPFLYYPIMLEGLKTARDMGFNTGIVTNAYYSTAEEDTEVWLKPLKELGVSMLSISNDPYHYEDVKNNPTIIAQNVAKILNIPTSEISIDKPQVSFEKEGEEEKGKPIIGGGTMFRGRAVEKLTDGLPLTYWEEFTECPYEDLESPKRVHLDPYGNVHLCQGLSMGNAWQIPLSELVNNYDANKHPICGPLINGGPALLAKEYRVKHDDKYVDACHFCYIIRLALLDKFPEYLAPRQVYGLE